jgi:hypothetical protein
MWSLVISCGNLCPFVFNPVNNVDGRAVDAAAIHFCAVPIYGCRV